MSFTDSRSEARARCRGMVDPEYVVATLKDFIPEGDSLPLERVALLLRILKEGNWTKEEITDYFFSHPHLELTIVNGELADNPDVIAGKVGNWPRYRRLSRPMYVLEKVQIEVFNRGKVSLKDVAKIFRDHGEGHWSDKEVHNFFHYHPYTLFKTDGRQISYWATDILSADNDPASASQKKHGGPGGPPPKKRNPGR